MTGPIETITVRGTAWERGLQIGRARTASVQAVAQSYEARLAAWSGIHEDEHDDWARIVREGFRAHSPESLDFLAGVSAGSGLPLSALLLAAGAYDLWQPGHSPACCTAFAWRDSRGDVWMGQTFDWFSDLHGHVLVMREVDERGDVCRLSIAEAGLPGVMGMNRFGLAVLVNGMTARYRGKGAPARAMVARAIQCQSGSEWLGLLESTGSMGPLHVTVGIASGGIVASEITSTAVALSRHEAGVLVHTNHFIYSDQMRAMEGLQPHDREESAARLELARSAVRRIRLNETIDSGTLPEEVKLFQSVCSEHDPKWYPRTLCCHPDKTASTLECAQTLATVLLHPSTRRMWLWSGNPCSTEAVTVPWQA